MAKNKKRSKISLKLILLTIILLATFLRLWRLGDVPVSLFSDELDVGYHAYSILKTGKDYSGNSWPLHFQSQAEFRTPLYIYSSVPTVALFGISPIGVRLPAAIFGILGVWTFYLLVKQLFKNDQLALVSAAVLTFSPWHIQYSRAAFEVTQLLLLLMLGLLFFFKSTKSKRHLWISAICFGLTPWIYSSAKLFTPLLLGFLLVVWRNEIIKLPRKQLFSAAIAILILGLPMLFTIVRGGGSHRFSYISVFTDPTVEGEVSFSRLTDVHVQGTERSVLSKVESRLIHNKFTYWGSELVDNYLEAFSTDFLYLNGDLNLRHSIDGMGQFYRVESVALILGLITFFAFYKNRRVKMLLAFWVLVGVIPSVITRDGGRHATRLILILPPITILVSYGLVEGLRVFKEPLRKYCRLAYLGFFVIGFAFYQHNYWNHNPWHSERAWHAGYKEMMEEIGNVENNYEKVIITNAVEPPWIYFVSWNMYSPTKVQNGVQKGYVEGFEDLEKLDKFYFGQVGEIGLEALPLLLDESTLYIAAQREVGENLIMNPQKVPYGFNLVKSIAYPSGEPAFYFLEKSGDFEPEILEQSLGVIKTPK